MNVLAYAATKLIRTLCFKTLAARASVERLMDLQLGSSSRSSDARDVLMALATPDFVWPRFSMMSASCSATTRLRAASSTSSWMPSSLRKSPRLLPRCGFFGLAVFDVGMFAFQGQRLVLGGCFLRFFNKAVQQDDFFVMHKEERSGDPRWQPAADFPQAVAETAHQRHSQRPAILKDLQIFTDHLALIGRKLLQPLAHRLISADSTEEKHGQRSFGSHRIKCINFDTYRKPVFPFT